MKVTFIFNKARRPMVRAAVHRALAIGAVWSVAAPALAQNPAPDGGASGGEDAEESAPASPEPSTAPPALVPPRLLTEVIANYPERAAAAGVSGVVTLVLTIDVSGAVTAAELEEPAGHGFDEAALDAARRFRFEPAKRNGMPVAARIRYRTVFEPPAATPPPSPPPAEEPPRPPAGGTPPLAPSSVAVPVRVDITVRGASKAERLEASADAVTVVETKRARRESADLGEVLRRTQGVGLQRTGGLGSSTRLSLNGMTDDQVRFFLDGVPLELSGFPNASVVPVNLIEHVEIYRGVVPVRFGTDALGGAVNLVTDDDYTRSGATFSYQVGSFGTHRGSAQARHRFGSSPFVLGASVYADRAANDYPIDVKVPNELGELESARVHRFHDAYRAYGTSIEAGLLDLPWARRLLLRVYLNDSFKEEQHNQVMTVPYGEVESGEQVHGVTLRYDQPLRFVPGLALTALVAYGRRAIDFRDRSRASYDWFGRRVQENGEPGEIGLPEDTRYFEHRGFSRLGLSYRFAPDHGLRLVSTLQVATRSGRNRLYESDRFLDPATAKHRLSTVVSGIEYEFDGFFDRLENVAFAKHYRYDVRAEQGEHFGYAAIGEGFAELRKSSDKFGGGDALRFRLGDHVVVKASYEYAIRLPRNDELFGDGRLILANFELEPETSHNGNLGVATQELTAGGHAVRGELNAFVRDTRQLIHSVPLGVERARHHNAWSARSMGVEAAAGWTSPGEYLWLDGNVTYVDLRNTSTRGPFVDFKGDRVPNRPWLYANASVRAQVAGVSSPNDELSLTWYSSYVHEFFRSWESAGRSAYKIVIDAQLVHSLALSYLVRGTSTFGATLEAQNLTDERAYDVYGVQKPGRAVYFKATLDL